MLAFALLRGAVAAGLGVGSIAVLVLALWISSPASDSSSGGVLHAAAGLWLLAHGAELIRADTLSGVPAPVGLVPLLLAVVPVWLVHRAARDVLVPEEGRPVPSAAGAFAMVVSGYLLVGAAVAYYERGGPLSVHLPSLLFPAALVVAGAAAAGVWTAAGRSVGPPPSWAPVSLHEALARGRFREQAGTVCRTAAAGVSVLLGGGALLVAVALMWHAHPAQESFVRLAGDWAGRVSVFLLALVLVPNAAVWGAAYGLGPGFALGTASTVTPLAFSGRPALPAFPLLAAMPAEGPGTVLNWSAAAVPVAAGATVAWFTVRRAAPPGAAREDAWSPRETALAAALAAVGCGAGTAVLAAAAGGRSAPGRWRSSGRCGGSRVRRPWRGRRCSASPARCCSGPGGCGSPAPPRTRKGRRPGTRSRSRCPSPPPPRPGLRPPPTRRRCARRTAVTGGGGGGGGGPGAGAAAMRQGRHRGASPTPRPRELPPPVPLPPRRHRRPWRRLPPGCPFRTGTRASNRTTSCRPTPGTSGRPGPRGPGRPETAERPRRAAL